MSIGYRRVIIAQMNSSCPPSSPTVVQSIMGNTDSTLEAISHYCISAVKLSLEPEEIKCLEDDTGFTIGQIRSLHYRFSKLDYGSKGYLEREDMLNIPELAINPLGDRIVHAFFCQADNQGQGEEKLSFKVRNILRI